MGLRVFSSRPFAWSPAQHDVNDHVAGVAPSCDTRPSVTVLAPSTRARESSAKDAARIQSGALGDFVAIGPALPSRVAARWAAPVGCGRTSRLDAGTGRFDIVHGFEPGMSPPLVPRAS